MSGKQQDAISRPSEANLPFPVIMVGLVLSGFGLDCFRQAVGSLVTG